MAEPSKRAIARELMESYGRTYAEEAGVRIDSNQPAPLFQLLVLSILLSARISADNAVEAAQALRKAGLTTPRKMADATWQDRVDVLTAHGYKRYDESASRMLGDTAEMLLERYGGDLRRLRDEAERDVETEHERLQDFKGIGRVGADIFLREAQATWDEAHPYADERVLRSARRLGLGSDARSLARLAARKDFPKLVAGLVRADLDDALDDVRRAAS